MVASSTLRVTPRPVTAFTTRETGRATVPIRSVEARMRSRSGGTDLSYLMRAAWIRSATLTPDGQATSQRLQFMQYFSA